MTKASLSRLLRLLAVGFISTIGAWPAGAAIVINEIMYHPATDIETQEYIELYNTGPTTVTLTGWRLAGAIGYGFPDGKTIAPDGYLVIAKSVPAFHARYPASTADVIGGYAGQLNNAGEEILLYDNVMTPVDWVAYDDEGHWPQSADGDGPSLELINPHLDHSIAQSWAASAPAETPGFRNSQYVANPRPFLIQPRHWPPVPRTTDAIAITVRAYDDTAVTSVSLYFRLDGVAGPFSRVPMLDDGAHYEGAAGDGVYGALLPPQPQGTILEFWIRAADNTMQTRDIPTTAPLQNFLLQADNEDFSATSPTYRVVMKAADHYWLHDPANQASNRLLNATFICGDEIFYNIGVRLRGKGSRGRPRKSYRVQFTEQEPFHGVENMDLNGDWIRSEHLAMDLMLRGGLAAPSVQFAHLVFKYKGPETGSQDRNTYYRYPSLVTMGWRNQVQDMNKDFLRQWFPDHAGGNFYRGIWVSGVGEADFTYYGPNKSSYRQFYEKKTNEAADDYSDVIRLCDVFTNAPDTTFTQTIAQYMVPDQWMHFWAGLAMMNIQETNIYHTHGDDYFMYFDPATTPPVPRAVLLPWDLDELADASGNFKATETIFACTLAKVNRFIQNPDYTPKYFYYVQEMLDHVFTLEIMLPKIQALAPIHGWESSPGSGIARDDNTLAEITNYVQTRVAFLESVISRELTVNLPGMAQVGSEYIAFQPTLTLNGRGLTAWTRWVRVNGNDAGYQHLTGNWGNYVVNLNPGLNTVVVECLTTAGAVAARKTFNIRYVTTSTPVCGTLPGDTVWTKAGSPYLVTCDVIVPDGRTLRIEPGTMVLLRPGCSIFVLGTLLAEGTQADPILFAPSTSGVSSQVLIPAGARWRYHDKGENLYMVWRAKTYDDSSWSSGPAPLGYGESYQATPLYYGSDPSHKFPCYYFRHSFQLSNPTVVTALAFHIVRDDGCVVYLNDDEVVRDNMPPFPTIITYNTTATTGLADPEENAWNPFPRDPGYLDAGTNVVAVEVHQYDGQSGDVIFNLELTTSQTVCWGVIGFNGADTQCRLTHCSFERGSTGSYGGQSFGGVVSAVNASVDIEDCDFLDCGAKAVSATTGTGAINIRRCIFNTGGVGCIASYGCAMTVEGSTFTYRTLMPANAVDLRGYTTPPPLVRSNHFLGSVDDILILGNSNATIEYNVIYNATDAAIQLGSGSQCNIHHNVIYDCGRGVYIRNGSNAILDHNTLYGNTTGTLCRYEPAAPGSGGGTATMKNTIIWAGAAPIGKDSNSTVNVSYSDIAGGYAGTGNFDLDPEFVNAAARDFHLGPVSPCRGRGQDRTYVGAFYAEPPSTTARHWHLY